jgi:pimeloyl-ACP methyl ester carboxylesterase
MIRTANSLTLWFALICLAMAGLPGPVRAADAGNTADQQPTLAITVGEPQWLEADGQRFLGIFTKSTTGYSLGAAILLPSLGRTPDWPDVIAPLRKALPNYSWNTLAIALPDPAKGDDGRWQLQPYYAAARARIQAAIKYLQQQGNTKIVLIGHGLGAAAAAVAVSGADPLRISGLAAISMGAPPGSDAGPYQPGLLESIHIPILDIYGSRDFTAVTATAAARVAAARRGGLAALRSQKLDALKHAPQARELTTEHNGYIAYRQLEISGADHSFRGAEPTLIRRIRGWLKKQSAAIGIAGATVGSG